MSILDHGYLEEEREDMLDWQILEYIQSMGPEYAWRLGVNTGIDEEEAVVRLHVLLVKGFLERVQGTILKNYHRQKDWAKHMNHTYYRLSRKGDLYLRGLSGTGR